MSKHALLIVIVVLGLTACVPSKITPTPAITNQGTETVTIMPEPTRAPTISNTQTPQPSLTPTMESTFLTATVWSEDPQTAVLMYHRFVPDSMGISTNTKLPLGEFKNQLQRLYDAGYSLVSLESWLSGDVRVPVGRRPIILTMDDLFFADQIFLDPDGEPSERSGLGVLWRFSQEHPDFGFSAALFYNMGDKLFANIQTPDWFIVGDGWESALSKNIIWCVEHASVYNHTYSHVNLENTNPNQISWQLSQNETMLRDFIKRGGREDLIPGLMNIIALPYGAWPAGESGKKVLINYKSLEGKPVLSILEADYYYRGKFVLAAFNPDFDRLRIPRFAGIEVGIKVLEEQKENFPAAQECVLEVPDKNRVLDQAYIAGVIQTSIDNGNCAEGVYVLPGMIFRAAGGKVTAIEVKQ